MSLFSFCCGNFRRRQIPTECWPGSPERPTDLVNAQAVVLVETPGGHHPRVGGADRLAAAETSPRPGSGQVGVGALLDQAPLELRKAREDVERQFAGRRSHVDGAVLQGAETNTLAQLLLHQAHQARHRAAQTNPGARPPAYH